MDWRRKVVYIVVPRQIFVPLIGMGAQILSPDISGQRL